MKNIFKLFLIIFLFSSCKGNSQEKQKEANDMSEQLMKMNQMRIQSESRRIDSFVTSRKFTMERSGTGLRYEIYQHGKGEKPLAHNEVEVKYKVYLLNGTLCYSSDSTGTVKLKIGENEQVRGLEEGLQMMVPGDKARLVLPAHLGYGTSGDQDKIPPGSSLYYDVELLNVKK